MVDDQLASGSLDDPPPVGGGVIRLSLAESDSLGHFWSVFGGCKDLRDGRAVFLLFVVEVLREGEQAGEREEILPKCRKRRGRWECGADFVSLPFRSLA